MLWGLGAPGHGKGKAERWECSEVLPEDGPGGRWMVVEHSSGRAGMERRRLPGPRRGAVDDKTIDGERYARA